MRFDFALIGLCLVSLGLFAACGGGGGSGGGGGGGGGTSTSTTTTSGGDPTALCTSPPQNTAPQISNVYTTGAMPASGTATGGALESGTYFMTAITDYESSDSGGTHQDTMVVDTAASTLGVVEVNTGKVKPTIAGTFTTSGNTLTWTLVCPAAMSAPFEYTYASGVLTFYDYNSKSVSVWTKQ